MTDYDFDAELWLYNGEKTSWHFVTVPDEISDDIEARTLDVTNGFGSVKVEVTVGSTTWSTSLFPDKSREAYILPMKKHVRDREGLDTGVTTTVHLRLVGL